MKETSNTLSRMMMTFVMAVILSVGAFAQELITVKGLVQDAAGDPLIGASVQVVGTKVAAATGIDGDFTLRAKVGDQLQVSYVGCNTQVVTITGPSVTVTLQESSEQLENLVVLGYGAQSRKQDLSASVGVVSNVDELVKRPVTSTEGMLQGQLPGVTITQNGGDPTSTPSIVIRGQGSQNGDNVLWVVDGVPGAPIASLEDIESIVVLKDAASAAIYGAQSGAGGVVLVTTKKAHEGPATLTYEGQYGLRKASNLITPLNAEQELAMRKQSFANANLPLPDAWNVEKNPWIGTTRTNWMDEVFRTAFFQRHNIVLNGGSETFTNRLSFNYVNNEGTLHNTYSKELGIRYNGSFKINKWVTIREDLTWKNYESRTKSTTDAYTGPILSAIWMPASAEVYSPITGTWGGTTTQDPEYIAKYGSNFADAHGDVVNPIRLLECENRYNRTSDIWTTTSLEIANIIEGLRFTSRFTYNVANNNYSNFKPKDLAPGKPDENNSLLVSNYRTDQWNAENTLTYENSFGQHRVSGLFSVTANHWEQRYLEGSGSGFEDESKYLQYLPLASSTTTSNALYGPDANVSLVARVGYSYADRYFVTASWRRDIAGRLVKESNSGDFPAVTAAWKISSEKFFNNTNNFNLLKVRASWGKVGNLGSVPMGYKAGLMWSDFVGNETAWYGIMNNQGGNKYFWGNMTGLSTPVNPNLTWETSEQFDIGVDAEFFHNRLAVSLDYFDKKTNNLIQAQTINWPDYIGLSPQLVNLGEISNRGFEFLGSWTDRINRDWSYSISGNFSYLKNKITDIGVKNEDGEPGVWTGGGDFRSIPYLYQSCQGGPLNQYYLIKTDGIFQSDEEAAAYVDKNGNRIQPNAKAGDLKFVDYNEDGVIDNLDRQYLGNATPDWTYALTLGATWKNLSVSMMFQGVQGAQAAYVGKEAFLNDADGNFNRSTEILNAWSPTNTGSDIPRLSRLDPNGNFSTPSDYYLENTSYLRMKNLTINYNLTSLVQKWDYLKGRNSQLNVYFSADNLFTITNYSGMDPEVDGYDALKYPVSRIYTFGINLTY